MMPYSLSPRPPALGGIHFYPMLVLILHLFNIQHGSEVIWYLSLSALFHLVWSPSGSFLLKWWDCLLQCWRASCCINILSILSSLIFFNRHFGWIFWIMAYKFYQLYIHPHLNFFVCFHILLRCHHFLSRWFINEAILPNHLEVV